MPDSLGGVGGRTQSSGEDSPTAPVAIALEKTKLGAWAHALIGVGRRVATLAIEPPTTLAVSLPTLDYAAALVAAGYVSARAERLQIEASASGTGATLNEQRFEQLCSMTPGSPIHLRSKSGLRAVLGSFVQVTEVYGERYASIKFQNAKAKGGEARELINVRNVHRVLFAIGDGGKVEERRVGSVVPHRGGLAGGFIIRQEALPQLLLRSSTDCLIIGVAKAVGAELCAPGFVVWAHAEAPGLSGCLQDVVRAAGLLGESEASQTKLLSVHGEMGPDVQQPRIVICRGASAYVRQAENFPQSHHIALLSPIEPEFDVAVDLLNAAYFNRAEDFPDAAIAGPMGARAMAFTRSKREPQ